MIEHQPLIEDLKKYMKVKDYGHDHSLLTQFGYSVYIYDYSFICITITN